MAAGSITTLGLGSGLELQSILDQLKEADRASISAKESKKTELQEKIDAYNSVNAKLFNIKSDALSLSLESDFLKTSVTVSDEEIVSATANDGIAATSFDLDVTRKARYNSWQTVGVDSKSAVIYTEPDSGIMDANGSVTTTSQTYEILYGAAENPQAISVTVDSGQSLTQIAQSINASEANREEEGSQLVYASVEKSQNDQYYIRLSAMAGGDSVDEQVSISGFDYIKADTTFSIARADDEDAMFASLAPGATYTDTMNAINNGTNNPGVTASLIDTGEESDPYRLTLTSDAAGEKHRISIQNLPMTEVNGADGDSLNAEFSVNGVTYQRQSNDGIDDVISGVTLSLKKVGQTSVGIQQDTESAKENIISLINNFNELIKVTKGAETDSEGNTQTSTSLENDYSITKLTYQLQSLFASSVDLNSAYTSLTDIGLEVNRDGTLTLDEGELDQAMASNPDAITDLFIGNSDQKIKGFGDLINDSISDMISYSGLVTTEIDEAETRMTRLDQEIETATEHLDKRYQTLTESFVRLDTYIQQLNAESAYMQSVVDSFNSTSNS